MNKFKNVKAWIGDDGYIHLNVVLSTMLRNGQEAECEIHDAALPLHPDSPISNEQRAYRAGLALKEYFYWELDRSHLHLNRDRSGAVYTARTLPRKMTKAQIEEALGYTIEFITDENEKVEKND